MYEYKQIAVIVLLFIFIKAQDSREDESNEFIGTPCTCGARQSAIESRIVGGEIPTPNEFPMMVAIFWNPQIVRYVTCGGTIISDKYVLTAAHCVQGVELSALEVVAGEHDITVKNNPARQSKNVESYTVHPDYNRHTDDNDIAIVTIEGRFVFNEHVSPACLPFKFVGWDLTGMNLMVLGWGSISFGGPTSEVLQKVNLNIISQALCRNSDSTVTSRQICTQTTGKDSCQHDSGGPALFEDSESERLYIIGIVSHGDYCAIGNNPGVNTRVTSFTKWITENAPAKYCNQ